MNLGDYTEDFADLNFKFNTRTLAGVPITLASGTISVYKSDGTTESTTGVTLTPDFDGITGLHNVKIDLSADSFYAVSEDYQVVITVGTVDSVSVVGVVVAEFSIENRFDEADLVSISGDAQSATDLKDFADAGYDPATNKVQGVVLTDTLTTYTGNTKQTADHTAAIAAIPTTAMRGTDTAALASVCTETRLAELDAANLPADIAALPTLAEILAGGDVDGYTLEETLKLCLAALAGKLSGAATTTVTIRSADDGENRIVATVDADGNRTAVTLDAT